GHEQIDAILCACDELAIAVAAVRDLHERGAIPTTKLAQWSFPQEHAAIDADRRGRHSNAIDDFSPFTADPACNAPPTYPQIVPGTRDDLARIAHLRVFPRPRAAFPPYATVCAEEHRFAVSGDRDDRRPVERLALPGPSVPVHDRGLLAID